MVDSITYGQASRTRQGSSIQEDSWMGITTKEDISDDGRYTILSRLRRTSVPQHNENCV